MFYSIQIKYDNKIQRKTSDKKYSDQTLLKNNYIFGIFFLMT